MVKRLYSRCELMVIDPKRAAFALNHEQAFGKDLGKPLHI